MGKKEKNSHLPLSKAIWDHHSELFLPLMKQWQKVKTPSPVMLITGQKGIGKSAIAFHLSQWLLCRESGFTQEEINQHGLFDSPTSPSLRLTPCGNCPPCHRALSGNWIDLKTIEPEKPTGAKTGAIKIEKVREITRSLGFGAHEGRFNIFLIKDADSLTTQAANSLLKVLEEPPKDWIFILTASEKALLLPTLVSRCQQFRLKPFSEEKIILQLKEKGIPQEKLEIYAHLAQGSLKKALDLSQNDTWEIRKNILNFLNSPKQELDALTDWASKDPSHFTLLIDLLEQTVSSIIRDSAMKNQFSLYSFQFWLERIDDIAKIRNKMQAPLNRKLMVQEILMPWLGESR